MTDFGEHSDDALHLSALGRSEPPLGPYMERGGLSVQHAIMFDRLVAPIARQHRYRRGSRKLMHRTGRATGHVVARVAQAALVVSAAVLITIIVAALVASAR